MAIWLKVAILAKSGPISQKCQFCQKCTKCSHGQRDSCRNALFGSFDRFDGNHHHGLSDRHHHGLSLTDTTMDSLKNHCWARITTVWARINPVLGQNYHCLGQNKPCFGPENTPNLPILARNTPNLPILGQRFPLLARNNLILARNSHFWLEITSFLAKNH